MDSATRQLLELRRDALISEVRRIDAEKNARIREVTSSPTFDPFTHTVDSRVSQLIGQENQIIGQIEEIDRTLRG